jgi:hypothetical protein
MGDANARGSSPRFVAKCHQIFSWRETHVSCIVARIALEKLGPPRFRLASILAGKAAWSIAQPGKMV